MTHTKTIDMTLTRISAGLTETGRQQTALGVHLGGLGLRHVKRTPPYRVALPAELAAKLTARPKVLEICNALSTAGLMEPGHLTKHLGTQSATFKTASRRNSIKPSHNNYQTLPNRLPPETTIMETHQVWTRNHSTTANIAVAKTQHRQP